MSTAEVKLTGSSKPQRPKVDSSDLTAVAIELQRCREDFFYFVNNYCWIQDSANLKTIPFVLWDFQYDVGKLFLENRFVVVLKARQLGISWFTLAYALWKSIFENNSNVLLLSYKQDLAKRLLFKYKFMLDRLPKWMVPAIKNINLTTVEFDDGDPDEQKRFQSIVQALPATEEAGRSETASLVMCDEWAHHPYAQTNFASLEPTFGAGGQFIGVSTANGLGNFYHKTWIDSVSKINNFANLFLGYDVHPDRQVEGWYEQKRRSWPGDPKEFEQEYPRNPMEAFIATGGCIFDLDGLQFIMDNRREDPLDFETLLRRSPDLAELKEEQGYLFDFWNTPRIGQSFVIGADPAGGGADGDSAIAYIVDRVTQEVYGVVHGRLEPDSFAGVLARVGNIFNGALIVPERNNHGYAVIAMLQNVYGYGNIYVHEDKQLGWPTSVKTKELMNGILQREIKEKTLRMPDIEFVHEAQAFVRRGSKTGAEEGMHDDRVIAIGVALAAIETKGEVPRQPRRRFTPKKHFKTKSIGA